MRPSVNVTASPSPDRRRSATIVCSLAALLGGLAYLLALYVPFFQLVGWRWVRMVTLPAGPVLAALAAVPVVRAHFGAAMATALAAYGAGAVYGCIYMLVELELGPALLFSLLSLLVIIPYVLAALSCWEQRNAGSSGPVLVVSAVVWSTPIGADLVTRFYGFPSKLQDAVAQASVGDAVDLTEISDHWDRIHVYGYRDVPLEGEPIPRELMGHPEMARVWATSDYSLVTLSTKGRVTASYEVPATDADFCLGGGHLTFSSTAAVFYVAEANDGSRCLLRPGWVIDGQKEPVPFSSRHERVVLHPGLVPSVVPDPHLAAHSCRTRPDFGAESTSWSIRSSWPAISLGAGPFLH